MAKTAIVILNYNVRHFLELCLLSVERAIKNIDAEIVKQIHDAGFKVYTYTVNEQADIASVKEMGVDGIFCDYPDRGL